MINSTQNLHILLNETFASVDQKRKQDVIKGTGSIKF